MRPEDYPQQEPLSEAAQRYAAEVSRLGSGVTGRDYRIGADAYQSVLVFPAAKPNGAVLAFMHGGGWTNGYKEWMAFMAPALNDAGITFVSVGYRLAPRHVFPAGFEDAADALAWLAARAADFGGDPRRIFVGGHSAGGHYAALLAVRADWRKSRDLPPGLVRGCLPISGVYDFTPESGLSMRPRFLGPESAEVERAASPLSALEPPLPPFLLAHGDNDFPHLISQAERFEQALSEADAKAERLVLSGKDHFGASYCAAERDGPWLPRALRFMETNG
jgi:arylformamidase